MQGRLLGIGESLSAGWATFSKYAGVLIGAFLVYMIIVGGGGSIPVVGTLVVILVAPPLVGGMTVIVLKAVRDEGPEFGDLFSGFQKYGLWMGVYWLFFAIMVVTMIPLGIGAAIAAAMGAFSSGAADYAASVPGIPGMPGMPTMPAASAIPMAAMAVLVIFGLVSLVLYIMVALRFMFAYYAATDGEGIVEAFKKSNEITEGIRPQLLLIAIVLALVGAAGAIACGIGIIVTGLLAWLALAHIYVGLKGQPPVSAPAPPPTPEPVGPA